MMINNKLVQMIVIMILLTTNLKTHLKTITGKLKMLTVMNVHKVRQFNQRNKTTSNKLTTTNNKVAINNHKITIII